MKIGDYVRTKNGMIAKIIDKKDISGSLHDTNEVFILSNKIVLSVYSKRVKKYSLNIIDLIEVGDIIKYHPMQNGYVKTNILYKAIKNGRELIELEYDITNNKKSIISIVTHEQFESMEYRIGG